MVFSIIVPIYQVEEYLENCLVSIVSQKEGLWEAILVDDGSPDGSGYIADKFAETHNNITVIHKENGGLSDARNVGLALAKGDYVLFLDSDDALLPNSLEKLKKEMDTCHPQVCFINTCWTNEGKNTVIRHKEGIPPRKIISGSEALKLELATGSFFAMAQGCVCERSFLLNNGLLFKKGIVHEDEQWNPRMMLAAEKVAYLPVDVYDYKLREGSITTGGDKQKNGVDIVNTCEELYGIYIHVNDRLLSAVALRYNAKLYMKGMSILFRCGERHKVNTELLFGKWVDIRILMQGIIFVLFPKLYAEVIDYKFIRGK